MLIVDTTGKVDLEYADSLTDIEKTFAYMVSDGGDHVVLTEIPGTYICVGSSYTATDLVEHLGIPDRQLQSGASMTMIWTRDNFTLVYFVCIIKNSHFRRKFNTIYPFSWKKFH